MLRARVVEVGRDRLEQVKNRLAFILVTTDISDNSRKKALEEFPCPVYQCLTSQDIEELFGFKGTKLLGFHRSPLATSVLPDLRDYLIDLDAIASAPEPLPADPKVAILGASGIGRYHYGWWKLEGSEPVAFLGSSEESVAATTEKLHEMYGASPKGFCSLERLLDEVQPDIVDVCLPYEMHYDAVKAALWAKAHVLCEKPFLYNQQLGADELRAQCDELRALAEAQRRMLGMCSQYVMAMQECMAIYAAHTGNEQVKSFHGTLISPGARRAHDAAHVWIDLAPHMLASTQVLTHNGRINFKKLKTDFDFSKAIAEFNCECRDSASTKCVIETRFRDEEPRNVRRYELDGNVFDIQGKKDADGVFGMVIKTPWGDFEREDMLRLLIRSFRQGKVEFPPKMIRRNLDWLLEILARGLGE